MPVVALVTFLQTHICSNYFIRSFTVGISWIELILYEVEFLDDFLLESKVLGILSKDKIIKNVFDDLPDEIQ